MANIIDGLKKAQRREKIELISLIETYTLSKSIGICSQNQKVYPDDTPQAWHCHWNAGTI